MKGTAAVIREIIWARFFRWLAIAIGITIFYYTALLASLIVRFGHWPNYVTPYDWIANVARIVSSTPSWIDALEILRGEWLLEIGYMNYAFGHGISEWSMTLLPLKIAVIFLLGSLIATLWALLTDRPSEGCSLRYPRTVIAAGSTTGTVLVGLTGATTSWVVCCATPSWIVGLTMLGLSVQTANWLEPVGPWLNIFGFLTLSGAVFLLASERKRAVPHMAQSVSRHLQRSNEIAPEGAGC